MSQSSKCVSSPVAQSNYMQPVKTESKKMSQVNNQVQVQTDKQTLNNTLSPSQAWYLSTLNVYLVHIWI